MKYFNTRTLLLASIIVFFAIYSGTSLFYPTVFGDEGFYAANTRWIAENAILPEYEPMRGTEILHEKIIIPPLYEVTQAAMWLMGGEVGIKLLIPVFSMLSAAMIYLFFEKQKKPLVGLFSSFIFLSMPSLVTYGVLNYTDTFLTMMFSCAAYFGFFAFEDNDKKNAILAGVFAGLGFLAKGSGFLVLAMLAFYFIISKKFKSKKAFKTAIIILVMFAAIVVPWLLRSLILYDAVCYHPVLMSGCDPVHDVEIPEIEGLEFAGRLDQSGTEANVWDIGLLNYFDFAFGITTMIFVLFGIAGLIAKKKNMNLMHLSWILVLIPIFYLSTTNAFNAAARAEDAARYTLPLVAPLAALAGIFLTDVFEWTKKYSKYLAIIIVGLMLIMPMLSAYNKAEGMKSVKAFSDGFFEGCDWIEKNTPENSLLFSVYAHHTMYFCNRKAIRYLPDSAEIQITNNDTAYEHLKLHGFDYVFVQAFTLSYDAYSEVTMVDFLNYMEESEKFERVLDNTNVYGNSGVILYKIL